LKRAAASFFGLDAEGGDAVEMPLHFSRQLDFPEPRAAKRCGRLSQN
jgi:hypothetical protein